MKAIGSFFKNLAPKAATPAGSVEAKLGKQVFAAYHKQDYDAMV